MTKIATFRPEQDLDTQRAIQLAKDIGCNVVCVTKPPAETLPIISIALPPGILVDSVAAEMTFKINHDRRYADLHRCPQTLLEGEKPNENWFELGDEEKVQLDNVTTKNVVVMVTGETDNPDITSILKRLSPPPLVSPHSAYMIDSSLAGVPDDDNMISVYGTRYRYPAPKRQKGWQKK
ncbi:MAG: hypothetical protein CBC55_02240 [Gammaproteobacteria bacterium TMED95]|nr:MAG: hypothetical protein CBC55_02240 [Gammaproteobacteria bacterium TMED95]|tara:strand:+ start:6862 stop:7398 length:537 start_codon:yes stop_codon:yes gene_type:complete